MSRFRRTISLAIFAVSCWAQLPPIDPMLNRTKDPPDVYTIGTVNGSKMLFRIAFFPYDQRYAVYQVPILLQPASVSASAAPASARPHVVGNADQDSFPPDLPPFPPTTPNNIIPDSGSAPPDSEPFLFFPWEQPDPINNFTLTTLTSLLPDPFATVASPPPQAADLIPWVDFAGGALNITNTSQPIGYDASPANSAEKPHVTTVKATSISLGPSPAGIVISRDLTTAYVAVSGAGQVAVVDLTKNQVKSTIDFQGATPYSLALAPDNQTLYVAEAAGIGGVYIVNLATQAIKQLPFAVYYATGMVLTPDASRLWICNNLGDVTVLDVLTNTVVAHLPVISPWSVAFNRTGTRAYISSSPPGPNGTVEVYDANSFASIASIQVGSQPRSVAVTPSGRHVFVVNSTPSGSIMQISTVTNAVIRTFQAGSSPSGLGMER
jgi:YVTN family beta-propeller protein